MIRKKLTPPLLIFAITLLLGIIFYVTQLFYTSSINARSSRIYQQSLIAAINQYEYMPALLARDQTLRQVLLAPYSYHLEASRKLKFITRRSGVDAVYIMNANGTVKATSNYERQEESFLGKNYSFRPYFINAMKEKKREFYYAQGATTGIPGFFISAPIMASGNGSPGDEATGVVVVKLDLRHWEKKWSDSGEHIAVVDKNNVIILSSMNSWRYKSIGNLPVEVIDRINRQQQFPGSTQASLFSKSINLNVTDVDDSSTNNTRAFWLIDKKLYLVNSFDLPEIGWTLYYLVKHDSIVTSALIFFIVITSLALMFYLLIQGRMRIVESKNKHRLLEIKRREELQTVMDNIHIGIILFARSGRLLSANAYAGQLLLGGNEFNTEKTVYISELIELESHNFDGILLEDTATPAYHESKTVQQPPVPVMFAISEVSAMDQDAYLMTVVNIQRRKAVEDEIVKINEHLEDIIEDRTRKLKAAQKELIQKNKAVALGNMAATIVHELSQPLTAMNSSIAAINAKIGRSDWDGVVASAGRLAPLNSKMENVIKLLKFFSYQGGKSSEITDLNKTLKQSLDGLKDALTEKAIKLDSTISSTPLWVNANSLKLDLVISNILQNAIDALEKTGHPKITICSTSQRQTAIITIQDNAGGVDQLIMEKMFSSYFTTKEVGKGLGLGLAITYEIIQEYNGTIGVENRQEGACFTISLPRVKNLRMVSGS